MPYLDELGRERVSLDVPEVHGVDAFDEAGEGEDEVGLGHARVGGLGAGEGEGGGFVCVIIRVSQLGVGTCMGVGRGDVLPSARRSWEAMRRPSLGLGGELGREV